MKNGKSDLTPKQEAFCLAYLETGNASEAYRRAYDAENMKAETIHKRASELLADGGITGRLKESRKAVADRVEVDRAWVLERLIENSERAMTAEPVRDNKGKPTGEYTYQGNVANRALELVGKEIGMFVDRKEIGEPGDFVVGARDLKPEEWYEEYGVGSSEGSPKRPN
jgi:phage terminase small subunit